MPERLTGVGPRVPRSLGERSRASSPKKPRGAGTHDLGRLECQFQTLETLRRMGPSSLRETRRGMASCPRKAKEGQFYAWRP